MVDKSISMNLNEVLELDYLVEEFSGDSVSFNKNPSGDSSSYISRDSFVFDPDGTGTYELDINGQIVEIQVTEIPNSIIYPRSNDDTYISDIRGTNSININDSAPVLIDKVNNLSLKFSTSSNEDVSGSTSGLDNYPSAGDSFTYYQNDNGNDPQLAVLFGLQGGDNGGYGVRFNPDSPLFSLFRADSSWTDRTNLASANPSGLDNTSWYGIRVNWGSSSIEAELKQVDQTTGDVTGDIATISVTNESTYTSGGVGLFSGNGNTDTGVIDF